MFLVNFMAVAILLLSCIHIYNEYPKHYTPNAIKRDHGIQMWAHCKNNPVFNNPTYTRCDKAQRHAEMNVRIVSLEQTIVACIPSFGLFGYDDGKPTILSYVILKTIDNVASSTVMVMFFMCLLLGWITWSFMQGPWRTYNALENLQALTRQPAANQETIHSILLEKEGR